MGKAAGTIGGAILGGIAGSKEDKTEVKSSQASRVILDKEGEQERQARALQGQSFGDLSRLLQLGPGANEVASGYRAQRSLASMLQELVTSGGLPSANDISQANAYAQTQFAPQFEALRQAFQDQTMQANQVAARTGRGLNDPIFANKMMQEQTRQLASLNAQQGAFGAQFAQGLPQQRLQLQQQLTGVRQGLASQALQNRQALLSLGSQLQEQERAFRLNTATRTGTGNQIQYSGGGMKGQILGAMAGAGAGMNFGQQMGQSFGSVGSGGSQYGFGTAQNAAMAGQYIG